MVDVTCIHKRQYGECFVCMMAVAALEPICQNCGDDLVCEGYDFCSDCLPEMDGDPPP